MENIESKNPTRESILKEIETYKQKYGQGKYEVAGKWQATFFNNLLLWVNPNSPSRRYLLDDTRRKLTNIERSGYTAEQAKASGCSHRYLHRVTEDFFSDVDAAAETAGIDIENSLKIREESGNDGMYSLPSWQEAYILLRLQGYNHQDLTA